MIEDLTRDDGLIEANAVRTQLKECSAEAGGTKAMECYVWMGAFNYLQVHELVKKMQEIMRERIYARDLLNSQLFLKRQDDFLFYEIPWDEKVRTYHYRERAQDTWEKDQAAPTASPGDVCLGETDDTRNARFSDRRGDGY